MKKTFVFAAMAALVSLVSCNKEATTPSIPQAEKASLYVSVVSGTSMTKATGTVNTTSAEYQTADEQKINNLQVFVFSGDARDGYASVDNKDNAQVSCTAGSRDVYCLVNAPTSLNSIVSKTALLAAVSELKEDGDNFEMIGKKEAQTIASTGDTQIEVPVNRLAAKIVVKGIKNSLKTGKALTVKRVFISNVAGQINYGLTTYSPAAGKWYNKGGYKSASGANLGSFTQDVELSASVNNGSSYTTNHYFYAYPNNYAQANYAETWAPKRTMLVIQIESEGKLYDYPIDLGVDLASNKMYVVNTVVLENLGNDDDGGEGGKDEEDPIVGSTVKVSVDVVDWDLVLLGTSGDITI